MLRMRGRQQRRRRPVIRRVRNRALSAGRADGIVEGRPALHDLRIDGHLNLLEVLLRLLEIRLLNGKIDLCANVSDLALDQARVAPDRTQEDGHILRADEDQRNHTEDQNFTPGDLEHGGSLRSGDDQHVFGASLVMVSASIGAPEAVASSSAIPFLKLLIPLPTSPMSSEIFPRPNRRITTTSSKRMC